MHALIYTAGTTGSHDIGRLGYEGISHVLVFITLGSPLSTPPPSPEGHLEGVDLNSLNTTVLEDFIQLACVEAAEGALLLRIFWQKLLSAKKGGYFINDIQRSRVLYVSVGLAGGYLKGQHIFLPWVLRPQ